MTGTELKLIMVFLMVLDHIGAFFPPELSGIIHFISRPAASVFAYLAIESYIKTKDVRKYLLRLVFAAVLMYLGNFALNTYIIKNVVYYVHNNIFATLALGVFGLYIYDNVFLKDRRFGGLIILCAFFVASFYLDYGAVIYSFMMICYIFKEDKHRRNLTLTALTALLLPTAAVSYETNKETLVMFLLNSDIIVPVAGIPFIHFYNGERGKCSDFLKYFFYIFYPVHLWIIAIIADKLI